MNFNEVYIPISGGSDSFLNYNPDRGFRTHLVLYIKSESIKDEFLGKGKIFDSKADADDFRNNMGLGYSVSEVKENGTTKYAVRYVEMWRTIFADKDDTYNKKILNEAFDFYFRIKEGAFSYDPSRLSLSYLYLTDWHDCELSDGALECVEQFFEVCRDRQIKNELRFSYNGDYALENTGSIHKALLKSQCITADALEIHTKQLAPLCGEYKDTIHLISNGFLGYVGEWARSYQYPIIDYNFALKTIIDNICGPYGIYYSTRMPEYRYDFLEEYPDYPYAHLICTNNDAFYGEQKRPEWNSAGFQYGLIDEKYNISWYDHVTDTAYATPQNGEMYPQQLITKWMKIPYGYEVMLQLAHHRYATFSYWHGYLDTVVDKSYLPTNVMYNWQNPDNREYYAPVSLGKLQDLGIIYDPAWLSDKDGRKRKLTAYEYIRDHLGYRLRLTDMTFDWDTSSSNFADVSFNIKNFGFAAAFNIYSELAILDEKYNVVSTAEAGDPSKWISLPTDLYSNGKYRLEGDIQDYILTHNVATQIEMPLKEGKYKLALRLYSDNDAPARLANDIEYKFGYHILKDFEITKKQVIAMKLRRIIAILLTIALLLSVTACAKKSQVTNESANERAKQFNSINLEASFNPVYGGDDSFLNNNPDRGFRTELVLIVKSEFIDDEFLGEGKLFDSKEEADTRQIYLGPGYNVVEVKKNGTTKYAVRYVELWRTIFTEKDEEYNKKIINEVFDFYYRMNDNGEYKYDPSHLVLSYIYLTEWNTRALSNGALECVRQYFEVCRERQIKNMLRFSYNWGYNITNYNEENRLLLQTQCINEIGLGMHTRQLGPLCGEFKDTIHSISNGFLGFVGEWASVYQWPEIDYNMALKLIMDNICVPNDIYYSCRMPKYRYDFLKAYHDEKYSRLIGLNCDAFYGEQTRTYWNSEEFQYGIVDPSYNLNWYDVATETAYMAPADGEMFTQQVLTMYDMRPYGYECMLQLAHHRYSAFSYWHGYLDTIENPEFKDTNIMSSWQNPNDKKGYYAPVTLEKLKELKIIYDPAWIVDSNKSIREGLDAYEYIRDHLGYRLRLIDAKLDWDTSKSSAACVTFNIKNFGFAAAFNIQSELIILNDQGEIVSRAEAGDPSKWISLPADLYNDNYSIAGSIETKIITHEVKTEIEMPLDEGSYTLALRLYTDNDIPARLANDIEYKNGFHVLSNFDITKKQVIL